MSCFKNAFSSGDHFTKESRQKATSEKLELEALYYIFYIFVAFLSDLQSNRCYLHVQYTPLLCDTCILFFFFKPSAY